MHLANAAGQLWSEARQNARRALRWRPSGTGADDDPRVERLLSELRRNGFALLPGFIDQERCRELARRIDGALERYATFVQVDAAGADRRLFGLDAVDEEIRRVAFDPFVMRVLERYQGASEHQGFALTARLDHKPGNQGSGQGWHRDSAAYMQTKCMVYLSDVGADNGPFAYVAGSHRALDVVRCAATYGFGVNQYRFDEAQMAPLLAAERQRERVFTAPAGTALLFDSRGLHRGTPIVSGPRYAITTYLWFHEAVPSHVQAWTIDAQQRNGPVRNAT